jgi:hypothetical protein
MTTHREKLNYKAKNIRTKERGKATPICFLEGEIVIFYEINGCRGGYDCAVVDCGEIFVGIEIAPEDNFKIGDYIKAEGRLDIVKILDKEKEDA